jgi:hypothetical protein
LNSRAKGQEDHSNLLQTMLCVAVVVSLEAVVLVVVEAMLEVVDVVIPRITRNKFHPCQLCGRTNHPMFKCYKKFDPTFMGEEKSANTAYSYGLDSNWYTNFGATNHVTGDLEKLAVREPYNDND